MSGKIRRGLANLLMAGVLLTCPSAIISEALARDAGKPSARSLPDAMFGSWGRDLEACTDSESSGRLHVTPKALEFHGARLAISRIQEIGSGWWRAHGSLREEGTHRSRKTSVEVRLQAQDRLAVRTGPGPDEAFQRCRPQQLQG